MNETMERSLQKIYSFFYSNREFGNSHSTETTLPSIPPSINLKNFLPSNMYIAERYFPTLHKMHYKHSNILVSKNEKKFYHQNNYFIDY